ncbi:MAG: UvrD-helicase domain-containing protein, partial [Halanaerobiales bacterium]
MTKIKYNKKQLEAINAKDDNIVIIAPAGSGKTSTLVGAIKRYKDDNPDKNVVAITFTRKSAQDLSEKLGTYSDVETSTIHSWAYRELDRLSVKVREKYPNKSFKVKLLQEDKIKEILTDILKRRNYSYVKVNILYSYIMGNYNMDISESLKNIFGSVLAEYIRYKRANGLYDFTDLPLYLLTKLEDYDEYIENIDGLFVDEFQDVDETQLELFNRVRASKRFYIGDPKQSIYIFR